jgi:geranylgeranyl diphosphate/geranylgeranyl-bacteriochlorophyllide a reductase
MIETFDVIVVGGGPAGAIAAGDLALKGRSVLLLDRAGRIKPCGGAIPPRAIRDFDIPDHMIVARATSARMIAPSSNSVDMPVGDGFVGMVDRGEFDEWLRSRAATQGVTRRTGHFESIERDAKGDAVLCFTGERGGDLIRVNARAIIGADGARSAIARAALPNAENIPCVYAYHEVIESPPLGSANFDGERCEVYYQGKVSPDFYGWVFPHGDQVSVGVGSANKGFALRPSVEALRRATGLDACKTVRGEGAPIPLKPLKRWDNGRDVVVIGDAAGVVAPASGEGIYYAMASGRIAADAVDAFLTSGNPKALKLARKHFMKAHGRVFAILGMMQYFWYVSDKRRERFVKICDDPDVQTLTWQAYMNKELAYIRPLAHVRIFFKDLGHLLGMAT